MRAVEFLFRNTHQNMKMQTDVDRHWKTIEDACSTPGRVYHNLDHAEEIGRDGQDRNAP